MDDIIWLQSKALLVALAVVTLGGCAVGTLPPDYCDLQCSLQRHDTVRTAYVQHGAATAHSVAAYNGAGARWGTVQGVGMGNSVSAAHSAPSAAYPACAHGGAGIGWGMGSRVRWLRTR